MTTPTLHILIIANYIVDFMTEQIYTSISDWLCNRLFYSTHHNEVVSMLEDRNKDATKPQTVSEKRRWEV